jgi:hypothetical protein
VGIEAFICIYGKLLFPKQYVHPFFGEPENNLLQVSIGIFVTPVDDDKTPTSSKSQKSESSNIVTLRQNGQLHSDTKTKANILNEQFQKAFTPATDDPIQNKGQSQYPQMPNIIITENGINKLLQNINIHKASGPDNIHGRILSFSVRM